MTTAICGAECWTDHRLIISKLNISIQPKRRQRKNFNKRLNVTKLERPSGYKKPRNDLDANLKSLDFGFKSVDEDWTVFRYVIDNTVCEQLDLNQRKHQSWFDENDADIQVLLEEKRQAFRAHQQDTNSTFKEAAYKSVKNKVQSKLR